VESTLRSVKTRALEVSLAPQRSFYHKGYLEMRETLIAEYHNKLATAMSNNPVTQTGLKN
jgi:hypothetical protein